MNEALAQSEPKTKWWTELAWQLYERLPATADELLKRRYRYLLPFKNLRIPIGILRGTIRSANDPVTPAFAGDKSRLDYLIKDYFESIDRQEILGAAPPWNLAKILKSLRSSADLTIALLDRFSAELFFDDDYLAVHELVGSILKVPGDFAELTRGNTSLKSDLRAVRLNNLSYVISHSDDEFERFYHKMYVPFIRTRHGAQAVVRNIHKMRRIFFQGGLLLVRRNGRAVAGLLFQHRNRQLSSIAFGTLDGEWEHVKPGANVATDIFILEHAKEH